MGKPVHSVAERPTNSFFEPPAHRTTQPFTFDAVNAATHEAWTRTLSVSCGFDSLTLWIACNRSQWRSSMLLHQFRTYRERTKQKRNALQLLALSSVVRPSHVELRYTIPLIRIEGAAGPFQKKPALPARSSSLLKTVLEVMRQPISIGQLTQPLLANSTSWYRKSVPTNIRFWHE
jgi:hypothetical protein